MNIAEFDYHLPLDLIATAPASPRHSSRLLVLGRETGKISHHTFYDLPNLLKRGDILVLNSSKVFPARLSGVKQTGGKFELLLNHEIADGVWEVIGKNLKNSTVLSFADSILKGEVLETKGKLAKIRFNLQANDFLAEIQRIGQVPLPPYIENVRKTFHSEGIDDTKEYQTVYAKVLGSVAAPTAGLHFTTELLQNLKSKGVEILEVTLHVGLGTFQPIETERVEDHQIHSEYYSIDQQTLQKIVKAKKEGQRIIAVGTTTTRVLEHLFSHNTLDNIRNTDFSGWTSIFIYPGYKFKCIDGMITNFHLPKSSLLLLVSALAGQENILRAYKEAIDHKYRFYSYGDAMLII